MDLCSENSKVPRTFCRSDGTVPKYRRYCGREHLSAENFPDEFSAAKLLPGQDKPKPSGPISTSASFIVSCGVRLSEVVLSEICNLQDAQKADFLTLPTLARRDAPCPKQGRSENLPTPYASFK
jgi:hypothetical protein